MLGLSNVDRVLGCLDFVVVCVISQDRRRR
jgi:hypothetical protein